MNQLITKSAETTMSSVEIAELTGKRHDSVLRDIRSMLDEIQSPQKCGDYKDTRGRTQPCLLLTKDESICLVAGYSATLRMAIIKRWQELEDQSKPQVPKTYAAALLEAGRLALELEQAEEKLAIAAPKAAIVDRVMERTNLLNATQVAQQVGMSAIAMNRHLDKIGCVYSKSVKRGRVFQQGWLEFGFGEMKQTEQGYPQALFTTSGAIRVVELLTSEGII